MFPCGFACVQILGCDVVSITLEHFMKLSGQYFFQFEMGVRLFNAVNPLKIDLVREERKSQM